MCFRPAGQDVLVADFAVAQILEVAARRLDCPDLGLRIARRQDLAMLGPLALAIRSAPTGLDALNCASRYLFLHARRLTISLAEDPDGARGVVAVRYGSPLGDPPPIQSVDLGLALVHRTITHLIDERYGLRSVDLRYRPPAPLAVYEEFFGAPVRTNRPAAALRVPRSLSDHPLRGGDEHLMRLALTVLAELDPGGCASTAERVQLLLQRCLGTTPPEIAVIARLLTMHPRTLQRRLAAENTSFARILDDVRRRQAHRYLTTTEMPMSQIAHLVGLADQSILTRYARRWWNATPREIRRGVPVDQLGHSHQ